MLFSVLVGYVLLKLFQLWRADGDLTVMGSSMKPEYYKDRVVWVTGASSGSKLCSPSDLLHASGALCKDGKVVRGRDTMSKVCVCVCGGGGGGGGWLSRVLLIPTSII